MNEKITVDEKYVRMAVIKEPVYVKHYPHVNSEGIWMPVQEYCLLSLWIRYNL